MGRCCGDSIFFCGTPTSASNYVCRGCQDKRIPLERCRFSLHYCFLGEQGRYLCTQPRIQVKKYSFVYGWYHLVIFKNAKEASRGTKIVNSKRPKYPFGLYTAEEILPQCLWRNGIELDLRKSLHRLIPVGVAKDSPEYIEPVIPTSELETPAMAAAYFAASQAAVTAPNPQQSGANSPPMGSRHFGPGGSGPGPNGSGPAPMDLNATAAALAATHNITHPLALQALQQQAHSLQQLGSPHGHGHGLQSPHGFQAPHTLSVPPHFAGPHHDAMNSPAGAGPLAAVLHQAQQHAAAAAAHAHAQAAHAAVARHRQQSDVKQHLLDPSSLPGSGGSSLSPSPMPSPSSNAATFSQTSSPESLNAPSQSHSRKRSFQQISSADRSSNMPKSESGESDSADSSDSDEADDEVVSAMITSPPSLKDSETSNGDERRRRLKSPRLSAPHSNSNGELAPPTSSGDSSGNPDVAAAVAAAAAGGFNRVNTRPSNLSLDTSASSSSQHHLSSPSPVSVNGHGTFQNYSSAARLADQLRRAHVSSPHSMSSMSVGAHSASTMAALASGRNPTAATISASNGFASPSHSHSHSFPRVIATANTDARGSSQTFGGTSMAGAYQTGFVMSSTSAPPTLASARASGAGMNGTMSVPMTGSPSHAAAMQHLFNSASRAGHEFSIKSEFANKYHPTSSQQVFNHLMSARSTSPSSGSPPTSHLPTGQILLRGATHTTRPGSPQQRPARGSFDQLGYPINGDFASPSSVAAALATSAAAAAALRRDATSAGAYESLSF